MDNTMDVTVLFYAAVGTAFVLGLVDLFWRNK